MSLVEDFALHIPFLRRFARALTGSQVIGDKYVRATLEALAASSKELKDLPARLSLYRIFLGIWMASGANLEAPLHDKNKQISDRINRLPTLSRITFLLKRLEGFTNAEICKIVGNDIKQVKQLLDQADKEIEAELRTSILIIEDEPMIAMDIKKLVEEMGHTVDSTVTTHIEALEAVTDNVPGLILADVQLADGSSGIEAVIEILENCIVPVIFITGHPKKLLTGEGPEPAYLITKPFDSGNVKAAISQALFFHEN